MITVLIINFLTSSDTQSHPAGAHRYENLFDIPPAASRRPQRVHDAGIGVRLPWAREGPPRSPSTSPSHCLKS